MHGEVPPRGSDAAAFENISGTSGAAKGGDSVQSLGCMFIEPFRWLAAKPPFCGKPTLPRSPYCARHAALCYRQPGKARR